LESKWKKCKSKLAELHGKREVIDEKLKELRTKRDELEEKSWQ